MAYTVVGMYPNIEAANQASELLSQAGFAQDDYSVSGYTATGETDLDDYDYIEDEKTSGFWSWLFGDDENERKKYSYAGTKSNLVTVYAENADRAQEAKRILDGSGAINIDETVNFEHRTEAGEPAYASLDEETRSRIINKAKNDLYLLDTDRNYTFRRRGMTDDMDSLGNEDL